MLLQSLLRPVTAVALGWYYKSIVVAHVDRIPRDGPIFIAVNHPNALIDALVVGNAVPRQVMFTAKATIFSNPLVASFLRRAGVVPLRRSADEQARAATAVATTGDAMTPGAERTNTSNSSTSTSSTVPFGAAPLDPSRNASTFGAVADALERGNAIVIFPEGRSHDEPAMAPLRTGLARMALMARDERHVRGIRIVPVGILFERKEEPRTRVLLQVGEPIDVDRCTPGPNAVAALTDMVSERLAAVTLNFESSEDAARINRAAESLSALIAPHGTIDDTGPTLRETLAVIRRTDRVNRALRERDDPVLLARAAHAEERLVRFRERLDDTGVHAEDLGIDVGVNAGARLVVRETLRAAVLLPFSLWGRVTHFVPIRLARLLAVQSSESREDPAMRTMVFGFLLVLTAYAIEIAIVAMLLGGWWAFAFAVTLVPSASSDFRYSDRTRRLRARAQTWLAFRRDPMLHRELMTEANWLRSEAGAIERVVSGA